MRLAAKRPRKRTDRAINPPECPPPPRHQTLRVRPARGCRKLLARATETGTAPGAGAEPGVIEDQFSGSPRQAGRDPARASVVPDGHGQGRLVCRDLRDRAHNGVGAEEEVGAAAAL